MQQTFPVVCLMGPTASGKSRLAMELAQEFAFHIISVDSAMVYRGLDIGTAKPSVSERQAIPHELIDICNPTEIYSAGQFYADARKVISKIHEAGKIPLLVGGTALYFFILQKGLSELPIANKQLRDRLLQRNDPGSQSLYKELLQKDPEGAQKVHPHDKQRIQRALEVFYLTGNTIGTAQKLRPPAQLPFRFVNVILGPDRRQELYDLIAKRLDHMFKIGFLDEVKALYERGDSDPSLPAWRLVGYRQIWQCLEGFFPYSGLYEAIFRATCGLAKRQITWLKRWEREGTRRFLLGQGGPQKLTLFLKNILNL